MAPGVLPDWQPRCLSLLMRFLLAFWFFLVLTRLFLWLFVFFNSSLWAGLIFCTKYHPYILSVYYFCLYKSSTFFFAKSLISSIDINRFFFSDDFVDFLPPGNFLTMKLSAIIAITNSNDENTSPSKMTLCIFTSVNFFFLPTVNFTFQFFMAPLMKCLTLSNIFYIFKHSTLQVCWTISKVSLS